jgi:hypothetical protein
MAMCLQLVFLLFALAVPLILTWNWYWPERLLQNWASTNEMTILGKRRLFLHPDTMRTQSTRFAITVRDPGGHMYRGSARVGSLWNPFSRAVDVKWESSGHHLEPYRSDGEEPHQLPRIRKVALFTVAAGGVGLLVSRFAHSRLGVELDSLGFVTAMAALGTLMGVSWQLADRRSRMARVVGFIVPAIMLSLALLITGALLVNGG